MVAYSFKARFVAPIQLGLGKPDPEAIFRAPGMQPKRQTIRATGKRRHARPGETLQLYTAMRTKQCRKIGEARCTEVIPIEIRFDDIVFWVYLPASSTRSARIKGDALKDFAKSDGFDNSNDMAAFWRVEHGSGTFHGLVIRWEPLT